MAKFLNFTVPIPILNNARLVYQYSHPSSIEELQIVDLCNRVGTQEQLQPAQQMATTSSIYLPPQPYDQAWWEGSRSHFKLMNFQLLLER